MKTTFSRRELYAFGEPIGDSATVKKVGGGRIYGMGGGGGGPTQTTSTVQNTNVPEYARPYVETMLGATQQQLFEGSRGPDVTNPETGEVTKGEFNITGFKPYQAYGGTYDAAGKQLSYDPSKAVAGFSDMQKAAQQGIAGMQMPGGFAGASNMAAAAGQGGMDSAGRAYGYGDQGQRSGLMGQGLGTAGGQKYGEMGAGYGAQGAGYGAQAADIGKMGLRAETYGKQISSQAEDYARQAAGAGAQYAGQATSPQAMQAYMSPYMQNVVDVQNREAARASGIQGTQQQAQATQAGAFGGGRDAIMRAERERNLAMLQNQNQAQGQQAAYQQAQQAQQFGANLGLQGLQGAQQGLGTALQGGQLGLSGIGTALQGQQGAMQGAGLGIQGAQAGLAGVDRQLAGTAQGMQGAQVGLQGVSGAQAGYGLANQAASNMSNIAGQQQQAQLNMFNAQNTVGAQQQAMEQQKINQAMQDYANAQQYPLMQLGTMSNMLRGLPMQASSTQQYQAAPNQLTQAIGTIGAGTSIYNALNPTKSAAGGEVKGYAEGGIMSYDMGGEVESQLESMDEQGLAEQAKESSSPSIRKMAQRILRERQMSKQPQGTGPMGVQYQAAQPQMPAMRGGGIIAFATPTEDNNYSLVTDPQFGGSTGVIEDDRPKPTKAEIASTIDALRASGRNVGLSTILDVESGRITNPNKTAAAPVTAVPASAPAVAPADVPAAAPRPAAPRPPVVVQDGIKQVVQQEPSAAVSAAPATGIKAAFEEARTKGDRPLADFMTEQEAERKRLGLDKNEGRDQERKNIMEELANAGDEAKRQRWMRSAKFFATWGSQPGPTLVAGMKALTESIPEFIADEKEQKKAKRDAQKVLYTLEEATRQEKLGNFKEAVDLKQKAGATATDLYKIYVQSEISSASDASRERSSKLTAELNYKGEQLRAKTAAASAANSRLDANERKLNEQYIGAGNGEARVLSELAKERSSKEYLDLQRLANLPESGSETIKKQRQDALDRLDKIDKEHATRAKTAADRTKFYERKVMGDDAPGTTGMSAADRSAAEKWLAANPKDPRAASIRQQLGR
jgi:hypothetical protein